jgi:hypothetical protein
MMMTVMVTVKVLMMMVMIGRDSDDGGDTGDIFT